MEKNLRTHRLEILLTEEEKEIFEKKMKMTKAKNMSHFVRKCVLEKAIYVIDLDPIANLDWKFANATNNINQIAKHVNQTGIIYRDDVESIKKQLNNFSKELWEIHTLLMRRVRERNDQD